MIPPFLAAHGGIVSYCSIDFDRLQGQVYRGGLFIVVSKENYGRPTSPGAWLHKLV